MDTKKIPAWQWVLAGCGVATLAGAAVFAAMHLTGAADRGGGPSALTLHPERQEEIIAARRADQLAARLGLDTAQTAQAAEILGRFRARRAEDRARHQGDVMGLIQARQGAMAEFEREMQAILRDDQRAAYDAARADITGRLMDLRAMRSSVAPGLPELPLPRFLPQPPAGGATTETATP